jgi:hypothetical protein
MSMSSESTETEAAHQAAYVEMSEMAQIILNDGRPAFTDEDYPAFHEMLHDDLRVYVEKLCEATGSRNAFLYKLRSVKSWSIKQERAVANIVLKHGEVKESGYNKSKGTYVRQWGKATNVYPTCYTCKGTFNDYGELAKHNFHAHNKGHKCEPCDQYFFNEKKLDEHRMIKHTPGSITS